MNRIETVHPAGATKPVETKQPAPRAKKELSPAAARALREAEARRAEQEERAEPRPTEHGGPKGPEPVRYGDWERKGIASDF
jgi:hypothetical protein